MICAGPVILVVMQYYASMPKLLAPLRETLVGDLVRLGRSSFDAHSHLACDVYGTIAAATFLLHHSTCPHRTFQTCSRLRPSQSRRGIYTVQFRDSVPVTTDSIQYPSATHLSKSHPYPEPFRLRSQRSAFSQPRPWTRMDASQQRMDERIIICIP